MCHWMGVAHSQLDWQLWGCILIRVTRIGSHIFRICGLENSGIKGFKNRKVYTTLSLTKMWQFIR